MRMALTHGTTGTFLILLSGAPFFIHLIPDGQAYISTAIGILAFLGIWLAATQQKGHAGAVLSLFDIAFGACLIYGTINIRFPVNIDCIAEWIALTGIWTLMRQNRSRRLIRYTVWGLAVSALVQIFIVILQQCGFVNSNHADFKVTGSFDNPGPLGCYIAMAIASFWPVCHGRIRSGGKQKILAIGAISFMACGLAMTGSRAAWLATGISITAFYLPKILTKHNRPYLFGGLLTATAVVGSILYLYRPSSADARIGIWKICGTMIKESPITGQGTNSFPADYMAFQTAFIATATAETRRMADDVTTAFNETVETLCEQGLAGGLLWGLFLFVAGASLWRTSKEENSHALFPAFLAYIVFAQFSYPSSVWSLHATFLALTALGAKPARQIRIQTSVWKWARNMYPTLVIGLLSFNAALRINANLRLDSYCSLREDAATLPDNPLTLRYIYHSPSLLAYSSQAQLMTGDCGPAVNSLKKLQKYTNTTRIQLQSGEAYECMGQYEDAVKCYAAACHMRPGLMLPLYSQFVLYRHTDEKKALRQAKAIKDFHPKIENKKTRSMRAAAIRYINQKQIR